MIKEFFEFLFDYIRENKFFLLLLLLLCILFEFYIIPGASALGYDDLEDIFTRNPTNDYSYGYASVNYILTYFIDNEEYKEYGDYYICELNNDAYLSVCRVYNDVTQVTLNEDHNLVLSGSWKQVSVNRGSISSVKDVESSNYVITDNLPSYRAYRTNMLDYILNLVEPGYMLDKTYTTDEIVGFFYNKLDLNEDLSLKIVYESENGVVPDLSALTFSYMDVDDQTYHEIDTDGIGLDFLGTVDGVSTWNIEIYADYYDQYFGTFRLDFEIDNFQDLDGTFKLYGNTSALTNGAFSNIIFENTYRYVISNQLDTLVSPGGSYDFYIPTRDGINMQLWKFNTSTKQYIEKIYASEIVYGYYLYHIDLLDNEYVRIYTEESSYVVYATESGLSFREVVDGQVDITVPGDVNDTVDIGNEKPPTEGMLDSDNQESLMDKFKNAFDSILNIIQFIFSQITSFYNAMPIGFQSAMIVIFFLFIAFILSKLM